MKRLHRCRNLDLVARLVARQMRFAPPMKELRKTKTKDQNYLLSAPATAALAISEAGLEWPKNRPLRLLLMNTHRDEFIDQGQWYRFVPAMLETEQNISVCACDVQGGLYSSRLPNVLSERYAIRTYVRSHSIAKEIGKAPCEFDLALSFSPLRPGRQLMRDLQALRRQSIPFYFTSSSSTHALLHHAMLSAYGACADSILAVNPFALVTRRHGENLNRVISVVRPENLPDDAATIDEEFLELLARPAEMVFNSHQEGDPSQCWPVGTVVKGDFIHTLDGIAVNVHSNEVKDLNTNRMLGSFAPEYREYLEGYDESWGEVDRLIWAGHMRFIAAATGVAPTAYQRERQS